MTSTADGMNLVAKEFVAAQDPEDPGVLVLSRFAGAAEDITEAVLVNPYDVDEMARAIGEALAIPRPIPRGRVLRLFTRACWLDRCEALYAQARAVR